MILDTLIKNLDNDLIYFIENPKIINIPSIFILLQDPFKFFKPKEKICFSLHLPIHLFHQIGKQLFPNISEIICIVIKKLIIVSRPIHIIQIFLQSTTLLLTNLYLIIFQVCLNLYNLIQNFLSHFKSTSLVVFAKS